MKRILFLLLVPCLLFGQTPVKNRNVYVDTLHSWLKTSIDMEDTLKISKSLIPTVNHQGEVGTSEYWFLKGYIDTVYFDTLGTTKGARIGGDFAIGGGTQDYVFSKRANTNLTLQGQNSGTALNFEFYAKDGDGTDAVRFSIYGKGLPTSITNSERLLIGYENASDTVFVIRTLRGGTGTLRPLALESDASATWKQLFLPITGEVLVGTRTTDGTHKFIVAGSAKIDTNLVVGGTVTTVQFKLSALNTAPANAGDTGTLGEIRIVDGFIYVCTATNTWKRVAISTW